MTSGFKIIGSNGEEYKSHMNAAKAFSVDHSLTFTSSEFDMAGTYTKDVTDEVKGFYDRHIRSKGLLE